MKISELYQIAVAEGATASNRASREKAAKKTGISAEKIAKALAWGEAQKNLASEKELAKKAGLSLSKMRELRSLWQQWRPETGHSMGSVASLCINGIRVAIYDCTDSYCKSCKYRPTHGVISINLSSSQAKKLESIGGIPTILGAQVAPKIKKANWLQIEGNKSKAKIVIKSGYVTADYHAQTIEEAQTWRLTRAENLKRQRALKMSDAALKMRFCGMNHSLNAGNCSAGTLQFIRRHALHPEMGYRLDYLYSIADPSEKPFVNRMTRVFA